MVPPKNREIKSFGTYISRSVKDGLRRERGTAGQKVQIQGFQEHISFTGAKVAGVFA